LKSDDIGKYLSKIDVLIINDKESMGYFAPGILVLS
jgi:hypothetical protein